MIVEKKPQEWYIEKLVNRDWFAMGLIGDGELIGAEKSRVDGMNAIEEVFTLPLCNDLDEVLRDAPDNYLIGTDPNFKGQHEEKQLDSYPARTYYDGTMWDKAVREGNLSPFIRQLRTMNVGIIGGSHLIPLGWMMGVKTHITIPSVNCYDRLEHVLGCVKEMDCEVWLLMMGLVAPVAAYRLQKQNPDRFFIDIGSVFDVFVGAGTNRGWRSELYADKTLWKQCVDKNLA